MTPPVSRPPSPQRPKGAPAEPERPQEPSGFEQAIAAIYAAQPDFFLPFLGEAFRTPDLLALRVLALGTHAYLFDEDWPAGKHPDPALFAAWFAELRFEFQKRIFDDLTCLAKALTEGTALFSGRTFQGRDSIYLTNAVKVYRPASLGKKASKLSDADIERHRPQWMAEWRAMGQSGVLPHLLVAFGIPAWATAYQAFDPAPSAGPGGLRVRSYRALPGMQHDFVHRLTLDLGEGKTHELLLVCLRTPTGRVVPGDPAWWLDQPAFRAIAGLTQGSEGAAEGRAASDGEAAPPPSSRSADLGPARRQVLDASHISVERRRAPAVAAATLPATPPPDERRPSPPGAPTKTTASSAERPATTAPPLDQGTEPGAKSAEASSEPAARPKSKAKAAATVPRAKSTAAPGTSDKGPRETVAATKGVRSKDDDERPSKARATRATPADPVLAKVKPKAKAKASK